MEDLHLFTNENLLQQASMVPIQLGYHKLLFYIDDAGIISKVKTNRIGEFYYSPSGGTLRDHKMNIVLYSAKFDLYKGYGKEQD
jgi:hypothetical protein